MSDINPAPRLLMGPGPINADPRVLRAMSAQLLGQFDPQFRGYMKEVAELYRGVFQTANRWTLLIDGTARSAIEAALASLIEPGDRVLVPVFGRFGHLKVEIARRFGAEVFPVETEWGSVFPPEHLERELKKFKPKIVAISHGDTSTTMAQPLAELGALCRAHEALLYVDATATLGGMDLPVDAWKLDVVSAGLQKCLGGPSGSAPLTLNDRVETRAVRLAFGKAAERLPGSSVKSMIGHAQGACGAAGLAATLLGMRDGFLPPTINLDQGDPECDLDYVPNRARPASVEHALCNTLSFGSKNSALVVSRA